MSRLLWKPSNWGAFVYFINELELQRPTILLLFLHSRWFIGVWFSYGTFSAAMFKLVIGLQILRQFNIKLSLKISILVVVFNEAFRNTRVNVEKLVELLIADNKLLLKLIPITVCVHCYVVPITLPFFLSLNSFGRLSVYCSLCLFIILHFLWSDQLACWGSNLFLLGPTVVKGANLSCWMIWLLNVNFAKHSGLFVRFRWLDTVNLHFHLLETSLWVCLGSSVESRVLLLIRLSRRKCKWIHI